MSATASARRSLGFAALGLGLAVGIGGGAPEADPMLARVGAESFRTYCVACHGATGIGDGPAASALRIPPADLTRIAARRNGTFPEAEIARFIDGRFDVPAHGSREMPIWGEKLGEPIAEGADHDEVVRGKLLALVEYLKTLQRP